MRAFNVDEIDVRSETNKFQQSLLLPFKLWYLDFCFIIPLNLFVALTKRRDIWSQSYKRNLEKDYKSFMSKTKLVQWKPLNVITGYVISRLMWSNSTVSFTKGSRMKITGYCYHLTNFITFSLAQSDHI